MVKSRPSLAQRCDRFQPEKGGDLVYRRLKRRFTHDRIRRTRQTFFPIRNKKGRASALPFQDLIPTTAETATAEVRHGAGHDRRRVRHPDRHDLPVRRHRRDDRRRACCQRAHDARHRD